MPLPFSLSLFLSVCCATSLSNIIQPISGKKYSLSTGEADENYYNDNYNDESYYSYGNEPSEQEDRNYYYSHSGLNEADDVYDDEDKYRVVLPTFKDSFHWFASIVDTPSPDPYEQQAYLKQAASQQQRSMEEPFDTPKGSTSSITDSLLVNTMNDVNNKKYWAKIQKENNSGDDLEANTYSDDNYYDVYDYDDDDVEDENEEEDIDFLTAWYLNAEENFSLPLHLIYDYLDCFDWFGTEPPLGDEVEDDDVFYGDEDDIHPFSHSHYTSDEQEVDTAEEYISDYYFHDGEYTDNDDYEYHYDDEDGDDFASNMEAVRLYYEHLHEHPVGMEAVYYLEGYYDDRDDDSVGAYRGGHTGDDDHLHTRIAGSPRQPLNTPQQTFMQEDSGELVGDSSDAFSSAAKKAWIWLSTWSAEQPLIILPHASKAIDRLQDKAKITTITTPVDNLRGTPTHTSPVQHQHEEEDSVVFSILYLIWTCLLLVMAFGFFGFVIYAVVMVLKFTLVGHDMGDIAIADTAVSAPTSGAVRSRVGGKRDQEAVEGESTLYTPLVSHTSQVVI